MDLIKLLRAIEEFIFEIALWILLIPKTFIKVLFNPKWPFDYVSNEWEKPELERFEAYISPILYWLIIGVLPYLFILNSMFSNGDLELIKKITSFPIETKLMSIAFYFLAGPLGFSFIIQKSRRGLISRKSIKRIFYTQCFCFGSYNFFFFPLAIYIVRQFATLPPMNSRFFIVFFLIWLIGASWFTVAEIQILSRELKIRWLKAVTVFLICMATMALFILGLQILLLGLIPIAYTIIQTWKA